MLYYKTDKHLKDKQNFIDIWSIDSLGIPYSAINMTGEYMTVYLRCIYTTYIPCILYKHWKWRSFDEKSVAYPGLSRLRSSHS